MGFKKKTPKEVTQIIESDIAERRLMEKMSLVKDNKDKDKEKEEEEYDNKKKKEDKNCRSIWLDGFQQQCVVSSLDG